MNKPDVFRKLSNLYMELAYHQQSHDALIIESDKDYVLFHIHLKACEDRMHEINKLMLKIT